MWRQLSYYCSPYIGLKLLSQPINLKKSLVSRFVNAQILKLSDCFSGRLPESLFFYYNYIRYQGS